MFSLSLSKSSASSNSRFFSSVASKVGFQHACFLRCISRHKQASLQFGYPLGSSHRFSHCEYHLSRGTISDTAALSEVFDLEPSSESITRCGLDHLKHMDNLQYPSTTNFYLKRNLPERSATVFIDGDHLSPEVIDSMCTAMALKKEVCRIYIARQPSTPPLTQIDVVAPMYTHVPTPLLIEQKAREWLHLSSEAKLSAEVALAWEDAIYNDKEPLPETCLQDVIFMCATSQWKVYFEQIVSFHSNSDADIFLVCPAQAQLIIPKKVIPAF